ncbi:hypothetical protein PR202_gb02671 [Eleusine coracana subsp. coracana]|uniref:Uncharacterized protein n=1 Tax=Eleusine coracana subsp. coracana TaxID=191504 RepID=A0AAV5DXJ4_ELECO|nr:hypothetical protein QOZ80_8BG0665770 [Eleusine coracana subsp. coracana]GJN15733.1 hypothetical protein PR202_gb02671 [Eleusine coracana subsp. coracana]
MRIAASKHPFFLAKHQAIPAARARVTAADPCSRHFKRRRISGARRWKAAVASRDADAGGGGEDDDETGQRATGTPARRRAQLSARRCESVRLPDGVSGDAIGAFLRDPAGVESLLNTGALDSFVPGGSGTGTFTCTLRRIRLLGFEVAPVLDLRVVPTGTDCTVEMLSCRFEGSESVEQQNELFSAFMRNHITWNDYGDEPRLAIDVNLEVTLEVYTKPFSLLPLSAVEKPGNLLMQGLLDRLVPKLGEQLLRDYDSWVQQQLEASS